MLLCVLDNTREYSKKFDLYRQRIWECSVTGKRQLTYEEALLCERSAAAANAASAHSFPEAYLATLVTVLHQSTFKQTTRSSNGSIDCFFAISTFVLMLSLTGQLPIQNVISQFTESIKNKFLLREDVFFLDHITRQYV